MLRIGYTKQQRFVCGIVVADILTKVKKTKKDPYLV